MLNGRFRNWMFTVNNPEGALVPESHFVKHEPVSFMVWQLEVGEEGTEHYQGYLELSRPCTLLQMRALLMSLTNQESHLEVGRAFLNFFFVFPPPTPGRG